MEKGKAAEEGRIEEKNRQMSEELQETRRKLEELENQMRTKYQDPGRERSARDEEVVSMREDAQGNRSHTRSSRRRRELEDSDEEDEAREQEKLKKELMKNKWDCPDFNGSKAEDFSSWMVEWKNWCLLVGLHRLQDVQW